MKKDKGITLIALVVTIVVMLILAGLSINIAFGNDGIFSTATLATSKLKVDMAKEKAEAVMSNFLVNLRVKGEEITAENVIKKFETLDWVASAQEENAGQESETKIVRIITTDKIILDIEFTPLGGYQINTQGMDDGEPYPNSMTVEQLPMEGTPGEKIKIKVTATVETSKKTTEIATIENVTTGESKKYQEGGVIFDVDQNGEYTFKAITNMGKSKLRKISINVATGGIIDISATPTTPRNTLGEGSQNGVAKGKINVTIRFGEVNLDNLDKYQYRIGKEGNWTTVKGNEATVKVDKNTVIVAKYYDGVNSIGVQNYEVKNVDNEIPTGVRGTTSEITTNSFKVTASAQDTASIGASSDIPGILRYEYSINDGANWQKENTFNNLNHNTDYTIKIKAIDKAGNEAIGETSCKTVEVPGGKAIGFRASTTSVTNQPVTVEITWPENTVGYTKKYSIDGIDWKDYATAIEFKQNGKLHAKLVDSHGNEGAKAEYAITWIDTKNPEKPTLSPSGTSGENGWYTSNVIVNIIAGNDENQDGRTTKYTVTGAQNIGETLGNSVTITAEGTSTVTAYTYDKAGNKSASATITIKKDSVKPVISGLTSITVEEYNSATFTNGVTTSDATSKVNGNFTYNPKTLNDGSNTITYTVKDNAGNTTTANRNITYESDHFLVDKVQVGDYVAYDLGNWGDTPGIPSAHGTYGGWAQGTNKGTSINSYNSSYKAPTNGWRVYKKEGSGETGTVSLISAGCPAIGCYSNDSDPYGDKGMVNSMYSFTNDNFKNKYASSAIPIDRNEFDYINTNMSELLNINSYYWLANSMGRSIYYVDSTPREGTTSSGYGKYGIRPLITLNAGIKTGARNNVNFLGQQCWAIK